MLKTLCSIAFLFICSIVITNAYGLCRKSYVCDDDHCGYQDICDSTMDLPSINMPPLAALRFMKLKPLPSVELPPLGTGTCKYMQVNGRWQNICY